MSLETLTIAESRFFAKSNLFDQSLNSPKVQYQSELGVTKFGASRACEGFAATAC